MILSTCVYLFADGYAIRVNTTCAIESRVRVQNACKVLRLTFSGEGSIAPP